MNKNIRDSGQSRPARYEMRESKVRMGVFLELFLFIITFITAFVLVELLPVFLKGILKENTRCRSLCNRAPMEPIPCLNSKRCRYDDLFLSWHSDLRRLQVCFRQASDRDWPLSLCATYRSIWDCANCLRSVLGTWMENGTYFDSSATGIVWWLGGSP